MADYNIQIKVDTRQAERSTNRLYESTRKVGQEAGGLSGKFRTAFAGLSAGLAIREMVRLGDEMTNARNKLSLVTGSVGELNGAMDRLFNVARETRSSFSSTVTVFQRIAQATRGLGLAGVDAVKVTENLNKAVILSGASAEEARNGLIQLSQGIASGALRGDELRSVLEQLPAVADRIADSLGVTRGELRKLGAEGKITARDILDAFSDTAGGIDEQFDKTTATVGQAFEVLRTEFSRLVDGANEGTGALGVLSKTLLTIADNLGLIINLALGGAALKGISLLTRGLQSFGKDGLKAFVAARTGATRLLAALRDIAVMRPFKDILKGANFAGSLEEGTRKFVGLRMLLGQNYDQMTRFGKASAVVKGILPGLSRAVAGLGFGAAAAGLAAIASTVADVNKNFAELKHALNEFNGEVKTVEWDKIEAGLDASSITAFRLSNGLGLTVDGLEKFVKSGGLTNKMVHDLGINLKDLTDKTKKLKDEADGVTVSTYKFSEALGRMNKVSDGSIKALDDMRRKAEAAELVLAGGLGADAAASMVALNAELRKYNEELTKAATESPIGDQIAARQAADRKKAAKILEDAEKAAEKANAIEGQAILSKARREADDLIARANRQTRGELEALAKEERERLDTQREIEQKITETRDRYKEMQDLISRTEGFELIGDVLNDAKTETQILIGQIKQLEALKLTLDGESLNRAKKALAILREQLKGIEVTVAVDAPPAKATGKFKQEGPAQGDFLGIGQAMAQASILASQFAFVAKTKDDVAKLKEEYALLYDAQETFTSTFSDGLAQLVAQGDLTSEALGQMFGQSLLQASQDALSDTTKQIMDLLVGGLFNSITGVAGKDGNLGFLDSIGSIFGITGKATGGTVSGSSPYIVGEEGPELFFPGKTGTIMPNPETMRAISGAQQPVNVNVQAGQAAAPNVNVTNVLDASEVVSRGLTDSMIIDAIARNKTQVNSELN